MENRSEEGLKAKSPLEGEWDSVAAIPERWNRKFITLRIRDSRKREDNIFLSDEFLGSYKPRRGILILIW